MVCHFTFNGLPEWSEYLNEIFIQVLRATKENVSWLHDKKDILIETAECVGRENIDLAQIAVKSLVLVG